MEKKIVPMPAHRSEAEMGASHLGNVRRTKITLMLVGFLFLGTSLLFAEGVAEKESAWKRIGSIQKRGAVNFLTAPGEFVYAFKSEKKDHPKAWPLTYVPRLFANMAIRVGSSVNDLIVLPWYVTWSDSTPLTQRFELPDYVWEKE